MTEILLFGALAGGGLIALIELYEKITQSASQSATGDER